jgi:hypothetical protein
MQQVQLVYMESMKQASDEASELAIRLRLQAWVCLHHSVKGHLRLQVHRVPEMYKVCLQHTASYDVHTVSIVCCSLNAREQAQA